MTKIILFSTLAGLSTFVGSFIVVIRGKPAPTFVGGSLGVAGGVMLAVVCFELLPPALNFVPLPYVLLGLFGGLIFILVINGISHMILPRAKNIRPNSKRDCLRTGLFIALGTAFHNLPEGIAIGAGYETTPKLGIMLAVVIGLHNLPEGIGFTVPLRLADVQTSFIIVLALFTSAITPIGTLIGLYLSYLSPQLVAMALTFAAGSMLYIVQKEIMPRAQSFSSRYAMVGFYIGFMLIVGLFPFH